MVIACQWLPRGPRGGMGWHVAFDGSLRVDWSAASSLSDLALLGNTRTCLARRLILTAPLGALDFSEEDSSQVTRCQPAPRMLSTPNRPIVSENVNVDDTIEMLPKSRRALTIQEIAALARSSLHGISQVVKDHVTKPTAMAQGRVAHLIEWKGWCKPTDTPAAPETDFNSYSDLTEGEQEARFAAVTVSDQSNATLGSLLLSQTSQPNRKEQERHGTETQWLAVILLPCQPCLYLRLCVLLGVAEQFAIAEAKLRAWSSVDGDESNDESYDEDFLPANEPTTQSTDVPSCPPYLKDLIHSQLCQHLGLRGPCCEGGGGGGEGGGSGEPSPTAGSPDTLCSSLCSLDEHHPLLRDLGGHSCTHSHSNVTELVAKILSALQGGEELLARLQRVGQSGLSGGDCVFQSLGGGGRGIRPCGGQDSPCMSMSYSETYLSPGEEDDTPCKDYEGTMCQVEAEGNRVEYPPDYDLRRRVSDVASSGVVSLDEEDIEEEEEEEERAGEPNNQ
ncbi:unnamed protein product [Pleuronectes platessa]|uniref:Family with sequence similarity 131 member A n=1 Tax=Pleuronectes platessa TaxID=8262 RepID=A0A9N7Z597_PLEPL|nr:unnamed protein product [Pleuronectes platessa]